MLIAVPVLHNCVDVQPQYAEQKVCFNRRVIHIIFCWLYFVLFGGSKNANKKNILCAVVGKASTVVQVSALSIKIKARNNGINFSMSVDLSFLNKEILFMGLNKL